MTPLRKKVFCLLFGLGSLSMVASQSLASDMQTGDVTAQVMSLIRALQKKESQPTVAVNKTTQAATNFSKTVTVNFTVQLTNALPSNTILTCWTTARFWTYDENYNLSDNIAQSISTQAVLVNSSTKTYSCSVTNKYVWLLNDAANTSPEIYYGADIRTSNGTVVTLPRWIDSFAWTGPVSKMPTTIDARKLTF